MFISVVLSHSKFNLRILLNLIFHRSGNAGIGDSREGKALEKLVQGQGAWPQWDPTSLIATGNHEDYKAECSSKEKTWSHVSRQTESCEKTWYGRASWVLAGLLIWGNHSILCPREVQHSGVTGIEWDQGTLPKSRWVIWNHHLTLPITMKRQASTEGKISLCLYTSVTVLCIECSAYSCINAICREMVSLEHSFLLHPEIQVYFLQWYSTELHYMLLLF